MGRPSKLSPRAWQALTARLLAGERAADLAREFGVSKATVSERLSAQVQAVRSVAQRLFDAEQALCALSPAEQATALRLAQEARIRADAERIAVEVLTARLWRR
ncbi:MAG: helix-turn-helix domain-containing protein [Burkholderiales bacterium]|nr:helix-turn-helix domain-containing protein [Burkholderiales bacterium]MDE1926283.1 helix-turn-helix domain-containing protein [Burkholderiales bacterium]MDE2502618.1 helix-turn-helix domain-containing protein [Burkholderiales bacterium]